MNGSVKSVFPTELPLESVFCQKKEKENTVSKREAQAYKKREIFVVERN